MEMSNITARIRDQIASFETKEQIEEIGEVSFIGDGIARVIGLTNVMAGELVEFENGAYGMAQNLEKTMSVSSSSEDMKISMKENL